MAEMDLLHELKKGVRELTNAVEGFRRQAVDEETVERIARQVMTQSGNARRSYRPGPEDSEPEARVRGSILDMGAPDMEKIRAGGRDRLIEVQASSPSKVAAALHLPEDRVREWQAACDHLLIASAYLGKDPEELAFYRVAYTPLTQALDSLTAAEGLEYVPRELSGSLISRINLNLVVANLFPNINMPTPVFDIGAFSVSRLRSGKLAENTADTGQVGAKKVTVGTRKVTLTAVKLAIEALVSRELEEDSIVAIVPFITDEFVDYLAADIEDAIINGDTAGTQDTGWAVDDQRKIWDGLRKLAPAAAKTDVGNVAPTVVNSIRANRKKMGRYAVRPSDLAHVMSMSAYLQLLNDTSILTLEKYGPNATVLAGELGKVDGSPVIVSEYVRNDLNATGVFDNVTTNRTEIITVNRNGFMVGERRGLTIQVLRELYGEFDQDAVIATIRKAFAARYPTATETTVGIAYNIAA